MKKYEIWTKNKEDGMSEATYEIVKANSKQEAIEIVKRDLEECREIVDDWSASSYFDAMNGCY